VGWQHPLFRPRNPAKFPNSREFANSLEFVIAALPTARGCGHMGDAFCFSHRLTLFILLFEFGIRNVACMEVRRS